MAPRSDSRLTDLYAEGAIDLQADEVARELVATEFLYKETLYGDLIEEFMRITADRLKEEYDLSWSATWEIVRFYAPHALKLLCLMSSGTCIPNVADASVSPMLRQEED